MAAQIIALGKVNVVTPGTPVSILAATVAAAAAAGLTLPKVHALLIQARKTNTGKAYIGVAGMSVAGDTGLLTVLGVPTANVIPAFSCAVTAAANALDITDFYMDADFANEGVIVSAILW